MKDLWYLLSSIFGALATYGPELWWKVVAVSAGYGLVTVAGSQIAHLARVLLVSRERWQERDLADRILTAFVCGALYTIALMYVLGGIHAFRAAPLWIAVSTPILVGAARRTLWLPGRPEIKRLPLVVFSALAAGPLLISLTCPVPSWGDVLETGVAPIQRLLTFGSYDALNSLPSALYPVNRAMPLFTSYHGVVAGLFGLEAHAVLAAALVPTLLFTIIAAYRLGRVLLADEPLSGIFAALSWVLSYSYVHLQDSRSAVWQMIFGLVALAKAIELLKLRSGARDLNDCAIACGAAILVHPMEGMFTALAVFFILLGGLARRRFQGLPQYLAAAGLVAGVASPLLWTWWPRVQSALVVSIALLLLSPVFAIMVYRLASESHLQSRLLLRFVPALVIISAVVLIRDFYGEGERSFLVHQLMRYPVPTSLSIVAVILAFGRFSRGSILVGAAVLAASLPLWLLPHFTLGGIDRASLSYELPLKGKDFWLSGITCITASTVLTKIFSDRRTRFARIYVAALLLLPTPVLVHTGVGAEHTAAGFLGMARRQLKLASSGYWGGWGDSRRVVTRDELDLYARMRQLVGEGKITKTDHIAHLAPSKDLRATPFPAFTGISQDLYLPKVDSTNIHTHAGRIFNINTTPIPRGWVVVERFMMPTAQLDHATIVYSNARAVLAYRN